MTRLSSTIQSAAARKDKMMASEHRRLRGRASLWLYRRHSVRQAISLTALIVCTYWAVGAWSALVWDGPVLSRASDDYLFGVAGITAGVYGVLLAVVALSVQLHAQRNDENTFMISYLVRKHGTYWIMAVAAGVVAANALLLSIAGTITPLNRYAIDALNAVFFPASLCLSLWFVGRTVRDATRSTFDSSIEPFVDDMAHAVALDQYQSDLSAAFRGIVQSRSGSFEPWANTLRGEDTVLGQYNLPSGSLVEDIDADSLARLLEEVEKIGGCRADFLVEPGQNTGDGLVLVLRRIQNDRDVVAEFDPQGESAETSIGDSEVGIAPQVDKRLHALLAKTYVLGSRTNDGVADELNEFLRRFGLRLRTLAKEGSSVELSETLNRLRSLVQQWAALSQNTEPAVRFNPFVFTTSRFHGPLAIDIGDVVKSAMTSGDSDKARDTAWFLANLFVDGWHARHYRLTVEARKWLHFAYSQGSKTAAVASDVRYHTDTILHSILSGFEARRIRFHGDGGLAADRYEEERPFLTEAVRLCLEVLSLAMREGLEKDSQYFFGRLIEHQQHSHRGRALPAVSVENGESLHDYAVLTSFSWALSLTEAAPEDNPAALAVLRLSRAVLPPAHRLVSLWEFYHAGSAFEGEVDARLGTTMWEIKPDKEYRSGVTVASWGGNQWRKRGMLAALLCARQGGQWELRDYFQLPPTHYMWDVDQMRTTLSELAQLDCLQIDDDKRSAAINAVVQLLEVRQLAADRAHAQRDASAPLSEQRNQYYDREIRSERERHRKLVEAIKGLGSPMCEATHAASTQQTLTQRVPRGYFLENNNWAGGFGTQFGEFAAVHETSRLIQLCLSVCESRSLGQLADFQRAVHETVATLSGKGIQPNLLIVPRDSYYIRALFGKTRWELRAQTAHGGPPVLGVWHGLRVMEWTVDKAPVALLCNTDLFWGLAAPVSDLFSVHIEDAAPEERDEFIQRIEQAKSLGELPDSNDLRVCGMVRQIAELGARDVEAAMIIITEHAHLGYATISGSNLYHKVDCVHVDEEQDVRLWSEQGLALDDGEWNACLDCGPAGLGR